MLLHLICIGISLWGGGGGGGGQREYIFLSVTPTVGRALLHRITTMVAGFNIGDLSE